MFLLDDCSMHLTGLVIVEIQSIPAEYMYVLPNCISDGIIELSIINSS